MTYTITLTTWFLILGLGAALGAVTALLIEHRKEVFEIESKKVSGR